MYSPKTKRAGLILLIIAAIAVWGSTGYRLIRGISPQESIINSLTVDIQQPISLISDSTWINWEYPTARRDPFFLPANKVKTENSTNKTNTRVNNERPPPSRPNLRLSGILSDQQGDLAILQRTNQDVYFVRTGQMIDSLQIIAINEKSVIIEIKNTQFEIEL